MTWVKLGDEFIDDAADISDAAFRTYIELCAWSNRRGLDLTIRRADLIRFMCAGGKTDPIQDLMNIGWIVDNGESITVTYRPEWQQSRSQVESRRENNRRYQQHRRGDHRWCDPSNCKVMSAPDKDADSADDTRADPVRDGTDRSGLTTEPTTEVDDDPIWRAS